MPRYHSEESLPSKAGTQGSGLYSSRFVYIFIIGAGAVCFTEYFFVSNLTDIIFSRIHSSADEISSVNRSPSELSSSDESFSRTDFSRDEEGESPRYVHT